MDAQNYKTLSPKIFDFRKILKIPYKMVNPQKFYYCFIAEEMLKN